MCSSRWSGADSTSVGWPSPAGWLVARTLFDCAGSSNVIFGQTCRNCSWHDGSTGEGVRLRRRRADVGNGVVRWRELEELLPAAHTALWKNLGPLIAWLVVVSLLAAAVAFLIGPSRFAVAVRTTVRGLFTGHDHDQTPAGAFIRRHTVAFRILGAAAALIALISIPDLTWGWFLAIVGVLAADQTSWMYITPLNPVPADTDVTPAGG